MDVVDREDLYVRCGVDVVANRNAALPAQHVEFADEAVLANRNASMRQMAKVVDVQLGMVHDVGVLTNRNAIRQGMEVHSLVEVHAARQPDPIGVPNSHVRLDCRDPLHLEHQPIENGPQTDPDDGWDPSQQPLQRLFEDIASEAAGLPMKIQAQAVQRSHWTESPRSRFRIAERTLGLMNCISEGRGV